jgi:hypothetical protein
MLGTRQIWQPWVAAEYVEKLEFQFHLVKPFFSTVSCFRASTAGKAGDFAPQPSRPRGTSIFIYYVFICYYYHYLLLYFIIYGLFLSNFFLKGSKKSRSSPRQGTRF